ncbi:E3 ubiquitin-protein ligase MARCHF8 [Taenia solium]|eukprot:TsM_000343100 transcript=TsM_000343100 gene=TsM_000343100
MDLMDLQLNIKRLDEVEGSARYKCGCEDMVHYNATEEVEEEGRQPGGVDGTADGRPATPPPSSVRPCFASGGKLQSSLSNRCIASALCPHPSSRGSGGLEGVGLTTSIPSHGLPSCRICCDSSDSLNGVELESCGRLIAPCLCDGSLKYVHERCIQRWIEVSHSRRCELCHFVYETRECMKPLREVRKCVVRRSLSRVDEVLIGSVVNPCTIAFLTKTCMWCVCRLVGLV